MTPTARQTSVVLYRSRPLRAHCRCPKALCSRHMTPLHPTSPRGTSHSPGTPIHFTALRGARRHHSALRALRGTPRHSAALRGTPRTSRTPRHSAALRGTPRTPRHSAVPHSAPRRSALCAALHVPRTLHIFFSVSLCFTCFAESLQLHRLHATPRHPTTLLAFTTSLRISAHFNVLLAIPVTLRNSNASQCVSRTSWVLRRLPDTPHAPRVPLSSGHSWILSDALNVLFALRVVALLRILHNTPRPTPRRLIGEMISD